MLNVKFKGLSLINEKNIRLYNYLTNTSAITSNTHRCTNILQFAFGGGEEDRVSLRLATQVLKIFAIYETKVIFETMFLSHFKLL